MLQTGVYGAPLLQHFGSGAEAILGSATASGQEKLEQRLLLQQQGPHHCQLAASPRQPVPERGS